MTTWATELAGVVGGIRKSLGAIAPSSVRDQLFSSLDLLSAHLLIPHPTAGLAQAHVEAAVDAATVLVASGQADADLLRSIEVVHRGCLAAAARPAPAEGVEPPAAARIVASGDRPSLHAAARLPFEPKALAPEPEAGSEAGGAPDAPDSPEGDDVDPLAETGPQKLQPSPDDAVFPHGPRPPVRLMEECPDALPPMMFYADVVGLLLDQVAGLARGRRVRPLGDRVDAETRLLYAIDALAVAARTCVNDIVRYWLASAESSSPWPTWAAVFALTTLAGDDTLHAVRFGLTKMPPSFDRAMAAADALAVAPHPNVSALARDLLRSPDPVSRAVGIDVLSRTNQLASDDVARGLSDPSPMVMAVAARAASRLPLSEARPLVPKVQIRAAIPRKETAWECCRALLRWGMRDPYLALQRGLLIDALGERALEVLVLQGVDEDAPLLQRLVTRSPVDASTLDAVARFGHPLAWKLLVHCLQDEELAPVAFEGLTLMFGAIADPDEQLKPAAWQRHIAALKLDPRSRVRHGAPWRPGMLANEEASLSAAAMRSRIDELVVRVGVDVHVDPALWRQEVAAQSAAAVNAAKKADAGWEPGSWETRRRAQ